MASISFGHVVIHVRYPNFWVSVSHVLARGSAGGLSGACAVDAKGRI